MKQLEFIPKTEGFTGSIVIDVPSYKEKLAILKEVGIKVSKDGVDNGSDPMELVEKLYAKMEGLVKSVDLKYGEVEFKCLDDLGYYAESQAVIQELQAVLTGGMALGK